LRLTNEGSKKESSSPKNLFGLRKAFYLAQEVAKRLGKCKILLREMSPTKKSNT